MKNKEFDCVEMKRKASSRIRRKLKGLSIDKKINFWNSRHVSMKKRVTKQKSVIQPS